MLPAYPAFSDGIGVDFNFSSVELTVLHMKMPLACKLEGQTVIKLFLNPMTHAVSLPQKHGPPET